MHFYTNLPNSSIVFVTDNGSNMKAVYRNENKLSCAGHNLNLAAEKALKSEGAQVVADAIKCAREVVAYFSHTCANKELHHTLKQDVSTRWNSQFFLLQSLASQLDDVKEKHEKSSTKSWSC